MKEKGERHSPKVEFQALFNGENELRCPGYEIVAYSIGSTPYEALCRCTKPHPHRVRLKLIDGVAREIPYYPWTAELQDRPAFLAEVERKNRRLKFRAERGKESLQDARSAGAVPDDSDVPF